MSAKKSFLILSIILLINSIRGTAIAAITITFEEFLGHDRTPIGTYYPGVRFESASSGQDWIAYDATTGNYNASSWPSGQKWGSGEYWMYDYVSAGTNIPGNDGKIIFDQDVTFVELGYCASSTFHLRAYDFSGNLISSVSGPANLRYTNNNPNGPGTLRADWNGTDYIAYVVVGDTGNYWEVDNIKFGYAPIYLTKIDDVNDGNCVKPGDEINYRIDYSYPAGPNYPDINGALIDYLPAEVNYVSSAPCGSYDSNFHTVTWDINTLEPDESGFVTLTVLVNEDAEPNSTIVNYCEIKSDFDPSDATAVTNICCFGSDIIYVKADANGCNNGKSWQNAYTEIQSALNRAMFCGANEIWVAAGTYKGTFQIVDGVALYGGFAGTETSRSQRNWLANETTLTGDINGDGNGDIDYVVKALDVNETTIIDGFKITKGTSSGVYCYNTASLIISNCMITGNNSSTGTGGGMYNRYCYSSSPIVVNCIFIANTVTRYSGGGGIYNYHSSPIVANCIFAANTVTYDGGGIYNYYCSPIVFNCLFNGNSGLRYGGGIYNLASSPTISNCTFIKNRASEEGGGIHNNGGSPIVTNCIFWGNYAKYGNQIYPDNYPYQSISYCDVQGGFVGTGNIDADPCFVDPNGPDGIIGTEDDNLRLLSNSPCIDAGNNNSVLSDYADLDGDNDTNEPTPLDLDGFPRFINDLCTTDTGNGTPPIVDMGAYEFLRSDINHNGAVNFVDYAEFALQWLETDCGECDGAELTCDGKVDYYDLKELCDNWLAGK